MAYVRTVLTAAGATAVQIVWSSRHGSREIEHLGSAHNDAEVQALKSAAAHRLSQGRTHYPGVTPAAPSLQVVGSQAVHLWNALCRAYNDMGFDEATGDDQVVRDIVLARVVDPTGQMDPLRVLADAGIPQVACDVIRRRMLALTRRRALRSLSAACFRHVALGRESPTFFTLSRLRIDPDPRDSIATRRGFKSARLEPEITIGLLTDATGFPLTVHYFDDDRPNTVAMLTALGDIEAAYRLTNMTVLADSGLVKPGTRSSIAASGFSYLFGGRVTEVPEVICNWHESHPQAAVPDGLVLTQREPASPADRARDIADHTVFYQYRQVRARRSLNGIDHQIAKAEQAVEVQSAAGRNRYIQQAGETLSVNREVEAVQRMLAGWMCYTTNSTRHKPAFMIDAYHQSSHVETTFRMAQHHHLHPRPIHHHRREAIEAHLTIAFAAFAVSCWIEDKTGWTIKKFVSTASRHASLQIRADGQTLTAAGDLPGHFRRALRAIHSADDA